MTIQAVYRNLRARSEADYWTISNAHEYRGHVIVDRGVTHSINFGLTDVITTNPTGIIKGCARITRTGQREVIATVGGHITDTRPTGEYIGRLTLNISGQTFEVITNAGERVTFNPSQSELWFSASGAEVYVK
jgi:hypothetical protein